jgi:hypothetical protein
MARRIFISYQHDDQAQAKGFHLLRWNKNVDVEFVGRHLLDPVDSTNADYVTQCIKDQIKGTSVTVVLIGDNTADSDWVSDEVRWSLEKDNPNGILGIRLPGKDGADAPPALTECGAEVINWQPDAFQDAIDRAAAQAGRAAILRRGVSGGGGDCAR